MEASARRVRSWVCKHAAWRYRALICAESVVPMCTRALVVYVFVLRMQFGCERQKGAESGGQACSLASDVSANRCESAVPMCTQAGVMLVCA